MMMDSAEHHKVIAITPAAEAGRPCCVECRTTATPMWRGGPTGPRSLCNACGIRYRKKRRQELGLDTNKKPQQNQQLPLPLPQPQQQQQQQQHQVHSPATSAVVKDNNKSSNLSGEETEGPDGSGGGCNPAHGLVLLIQIHAAAWLGGSQHHPTQPREAAAALLNVCVHIQDTEETQTDHPVVPSQPCNFFLIIKKMASFQDG